MMTMFIKFKSAYKKIAMGLLSYMPEEKDVKKLQETIKVYEENENWQLYLWKEDDDIVGVLGLSFPDDHMARLEHVCVNPSYRDEGIGKKMVRTIQEKIDRELVGREETIEFLDVCKEGIKTKREVSG
ncbi:riboflavin biosynthesis RibT protein [Alteribacillus persepolensis]|uniref:Riboflavin biosynthesis RibT protein n=1 Tax=Alteribacillus persepolensis TaxID=568899 RepID=A0A1G7ZMI1_9BACI|nr:GNAT family N-acetyltransferase [Alteribacillus persepolensis]SDH09962.1 riboflavin biosynthesis RibT protein [Alteribacillus persepolensis]